MAGNTFTIEKGNFNNNDNFNNNNRIVGYWQWEKDSAIKNPTKHEIFVNDRPINSSLKATNIRIRRGPGVIDWDQTGTFELSTSGQQKINTTSPTSQWQLYKNTNLEFTNRKTCNACVSWPNGEEEMGLWSIPENKCVIYKNGSVRLNREGVKRHNKEYVVINNKYDNFWRNELEKKDCP